LNDENPTTLFSAGNKGKVKNKSDNMFNPYQCNVSKNGKETKEEKNKGNGFYCGAPVHFKKHCGKWLAWVEEVKKRKAVQANMTSRNNKEQLFSITTSPNSNVSSDGIYIQEQLNK